jgi:hypothetical protein
MTYKDGGEGGIRTRQDPLDSVSYRFHNARAAVDASNAVAPCPLLPAIENNSEPTCLWTTRLERADLPLLIRHTQNEQRVLDVSIDEARICRRRVVIS